MPNRIIKESIWSSQSLSKVSLLAQGFFLRLLPLPDDHGCFDARPSILRGRLFPLQIDKVKESQISGWLQELLSIDSIRLWVDAKGIQYGFIPSWSDHQQIRSLHHRKTPEPPPEIYSENSIAINCNQPIAIDTPIPNPNPNLNLNPKIHYAGAFEKFWKLYPKKNGKAESYTEWKKLNPDETLQEQIVRSLQNQISERKNQTNQGQFIPQWKDPCRWLKYRRWEDEINPSQTETAAKKKTPVDIVLEAERKRQAEENQTGTE